MRLFIPTWRVVALEAVIAIVLFAYGHWIIGGICAVGALDGAYRRAASKPRYPGDIFDSEKR